MICIEVDIHAGLTELGRDCRNLELHEGATVIDLLCELKIKPSHLGLLVVNQVKGDTSQVLQDGDKVTLIPFLDAG